MKNTPFLAWLLCLCLACSDSSNGENNVPDEIISAVAKNFINEVLDVMEANSLNRNTIDWESFRDEVFETAGAAQTINAVYDSGAIVRALELLGDNHSKISRENGEVLSASTVICPFSDIEPPSAESIPANIGYIFITGFNSPTEEERTSFAENLQEIIREKDSPENIGWIVDLRPNNGGNMWPMLAGIGPILGEGIAGYFVGPNGEETPWSYSEGSSISGQRTVTQVQNPYTLFNDGPKVAVLLDVFTASSGEAIAISFSNRNNTSFFGTASCGLSTANSSFVLSDESLLNLTTAVLADRQKNAFGGKIKPDFPVNNDELIARAIEWLNNE